jgi:CubicO group peptidase (beta-lactamase class C family)
MSRLLLLVLLAGPATPDLDRTIEQLRRDLGVPGAAVAIVKDGTIVLQKGFGLRDIERNLPVTSETRFAIGSCTKAFTAMAAVMSADEGKLSLDDPPRKHLPYFRLRDPEADARVTLRDLLRHTPGLDRTDLAWATGALNREEVILVAGSAKPTAGIGEKFQYQNPMFSAAGEIVARANGTTWEEYIAARLFRPLGMASSDTSIRERAQAADHATGYRLQERTATNAMVRDLTNIAPAGAINSNLPDMVRWIRLMLGNGVFESRRLVSEKGFGELVRMQISMGGKNGYGLGWALGDWCGQRILTHGGGIDGFNALVALVPDRRLGLVVLTNVTASALPGRILDAVLRTFVGNPSATPDGTPPPPSASSSVDIGADALMAKVIAAAGGETNLRRHRSRKTTLSLDFETQGLTGESVVEAQAPNRSVTTITLFGLGRPLGTIRSHFDGAKGGSECSFASPEVFQGPALDDARLVADFHELLNWKTLYKSVVVREKSRLGNEEVYVVVKTPEKGTPVIDRISGSSFLRIQRDRESFSDYRNVEGVMIPFTTVTDHPLMGRIVGKVKEVRFDAPR